MGAILGTLAFFMAFFAIWFTSEALRRADGKGDALLKPYIRGLKGQLAHNRSLIAQMEARMRDMERRIEALKAERMAARDISGQVDVMRDNLDKNRGFKPTSY